MRYRQHVNDAKHHRSKTRCACWVYSVLQRGLEPICFQIEACEENWEESEKFWISYFRFLGADLMNLTDGGDGSAGYRHPLEIRQKIAALAKARVTPELRAQISKSGRAAWQNPETRENLVLARQKMASNPDFRRKQSEARSALWETAEYRDKVCAAQQKVDRKAIAREFWKRPEYRARRRKSGVLPGVFNPSS